MILPGNTTGTLPQIIYDEIKGDIMIKGKSICCEVNDYFEEFLTYLRDCVEKNPTDMNIIIDFDYFNTKTARILVDFFRIIKTKIVDRGFKANITWVYEEGDEDLKEAGEDFENLSKLKIKLQEKPEL